MRAYFFAHSYLSGIQKGIQAQHCTAEIFRRCDKIPSMKSQLMEWANLHKTTIILNGGDCTVLDILSNCLSLRWASLYLPWGYFNEDASLNHAITCVGVIVPERIYAATNPVGSLTGDEQWLHNEIWSRSLAQ